MLAELWMLSGAAGLPADRDPWGPSLAEDSSFAWVRPCSGALPGGKRHIRWDGTPKQQLTRRGKCPNHRCGFTLLSRGIHRIGQQWLCTRNGPRRLGKQGGGDYTNQHVAKMQPR